MFQNANPSIPQINQGNYIPVNEYYFLFNSVDKKHILLKNFKRFMNYTHIFDVSTKKAYVLPLKLSLPFMNCLICVSNLNSL